MNIVQTLKIKAAAAGSNLTEICRRAGVNRQTVEQWKDDEPKTLKILRKIEAEIEKIKTENAAIQKA
jgi:transcriptional regulator with XRE-family HTH domain